MGSFACAASAASIFATAWLVACGASLPTDAERAATATPATVSSAPAPLASSSSSALVVPPPHKKRRRHDAIPSGAHGEKVELSGAVVENASDPDDRVILAIGDTCKIEVPPSSPGDATHEYEDVDCPADYDDPAWDGCPFVLVRVASRCYCTSEGGGKPPRPTPCPKLDRSAR